MPLATSSTCSRRTSFRPVTICFDRKHFVIYLLVRITDAFILVAKKVFGTNVCYSSCQCTISAYYKIDVYFFHPIHSGKTAFYKTCRRQELLYNSVGFCIEVINRHSICDLASLLGKYILYKGFT